MTAVLLQLKGLAADATEPRRTKLDDAQEVVKRSLEDVRRLAQELRPEALDYLGLKPALSHLAVDFERRTQVHVQRRIAGDLPRLDPAAELAIYRVAQESLTNVARHAQASEVLLSLQPGVEGVVLRVVDDGRGLDPGQAECGGLLFGWLLGLPLGYALAQGIIALTSSLAHIDLTFAFPTVNLAITLIGTIVLALLVLLAPVRRAVRFKPGEAIRYA